MLRLVEERLEAEGAEPLTPTEQAVRWACRARWGVYQPGLVEQAQLAHVIEALVNPARPLNRGIQSAWRLMSGR